ncbi:MAG: SUMF1/EgtB/PvdO family nonheme iron enzyme [Bacteroidales bacterium]|nr:SUMF1/EgtB/PvdO family nonheme iron enzyme [Bacteroidales bacterium]
MIRISISRLTYSIVVLGSLFFLSSCNLFQQQEVSRTTGWTLGEEGTGTFTRTQLRHQDPGPGMVFIEGGTFVMGRTNEDIMYDWNNLPRRVSVASFYMDETEITNFEYREYLHWLSRVFRTTHPDIYLNALPDTLVWRDPLAYNEPFVENYLRHPAYDDYPVVGVSWVQASDFAAWRTDRVNEWILVQNGFLELNLDDQRPGNYFTTQAYLAGAYEGLVREDQQQRARWEDGLLLPRYRLPTEAEWEFAALGLIGKTVGDNVTERRTYPWSGNNMRSTERRTRGEFLANFQRGYGDLTGIAGASQRSGELTMHVRSFLPNDYGLYNMAGNVNEWVKDVYRPLSHEKVAEFRPFRGNVFRTAARDENGNILFDDLGRVIFEEADNNEQQNSRDYRQGNFIDYRDGDQMSAIAMGQSVYPEGLTLITNQSRVYKGGSWKDRSYWLSPATRRHLDQNKATNDIGFRCVMDHLGQKP